MLLHRRIASLLELLNRRHVITSPTVADFLARNHGLFGDARMEDTGAGGGGAGDGGGGDGAGGGAGDGGAGNGGNAGGGDGGAGGSGSSSSGGSQGDRGYPADTPLEQMKPEEREAYWRYHSRKHEGHVKALGGITADELKTLREKAAKSDELERELMSDTEKKVADAKAAGERETAEKLQPLLLSARFEAEAAGRQIAGKPIEVDKVLAPLDTKQFMTDAGTVDTAKVVEFLDGIAPKPTGNGRDLGQGRRGSGTGPSVQAGRDMYAESRKKRSSASS